MASSQGQGNPAGEPSLAAYARLGHAAPGPRKRNNIQIDTSAAARPNPNTPRELAESFSSAVSPTTDDALTGFRRRTSSTSSPGPRRRSTTLAHSTLGPHPPPPPWYTSTPEVDNNRDANASASASSSEISSDPDRLRDLGYGRHGNPRGSRIIGPSTLQDPAYTRRAALGEQRTTLGATEWACEDVEPPSPSDFGHGLRVRENTERKRRQRSKSNLSQQQSAAHSKRSLMGDVEGAERAQRAVNTTATPPTPATPCGRASQSSGCEHPHVHGETCSSTYVAQDTDAYLSITTSRNGSGSGSSHTSFDLASDATGGWADESSSDDEDAGWWWTTGAASSQGIGSTRVLRTRKWSWFFSPLRAMMFSVTGAPRGRLRPRRRRGIEDESVGLIGGGAGTKRERRNRGPLLGSLWLGIVRNYVVDEPWMIALFFAFLCVFALVLGCTIKYILDPDKVQLPWRQYCTPDYPTVYSLQAGLSDGYTPFHPDGSGVSLRPVTPSHRLWPYPGRPVPPLAEDSQSEYVDSLEPATLFLAVFTYDKALERRNLIRESYMTHPRSRTESVRVRFVMGRPRKALARAIELEQELHGDIVILDMAENMNSGKSHTYFSWAASNATVADYEYPSHPRTPESAAEFKRLADLGQDVKPVYRGEKKPDFIAKADDDAFIVLSELERHLRVVPRTKAIWGWLVRDLFMAGECYAMSRDLVEYIRDTEAIASHVVGKEDKLVSKWLHMHPEREDIVWVTERCWVYDHPRANTVYAHGFLFPNELARLRGEWDDGLREDEYERRGGEQAKAERWSSVSEYGTRYQPPVRGLVREEQREALIEGSAMSRLRESPRQWRAHIAEKVRDLMALRPSLDARFLGDKRGRGGTVLVHFIKRAEWFRETSAVLLGPVKS